MKTKEVGVRDYKKEFENLFDSICYRHPKFTVWNDFVHMAAYSISNAVNYRQDREDAYMNIVKKYTKDEANKIAELLSLLTLALEDNREQDFLGQLYMDYKFGDHKKGEYFTPYHVAGLMSELTGCQIDETESFTTVNDPCCGSGVLLIAYANKLLKAGMNHHLKLLVVANDTNPCIALMCYIQLSLLGCAGYICIRNTFTEPMTGELLTPPDDAFIMPLFLHPVWKFRQERSKILMDGDKNDMG